MGTAGDEVPGLGERLRDLRQERGLSQADLAGPGLSPSYVSLVESGRRSPSAAVLAVLAGQLGVSALYLTTGREEDGEVEARAELAFVRMAVANGEAGAAIERGLNLQRSAGPEWSRRDELDHVLATAFEGIGDLERACALLEPVAARARRGATQVSVVRSHMDLAGYYLEAGDAFRAAEVADLGLTAATGTGWSADPELARLAATAVWAYLERGDALYASLKAAEYLAALPADAVPHAAAGLLWNQALAKQSLGQHRAAIALIERASALMSETDAGRDVARARLARAWLMLRAPDPDLGVVLTALHDVRRRLRVASAPVDVASCELELARAYLLSGDAASAVTHAEAARKHLGREHRASSADAASLLARALLAVGQPDRVPALLDEARSHLLHTPAARSAALPWAQLAGALEGAGDDVAALDAAYRALDAAGVRTRWPALAGQVVQPSPPG